MKKVYLDLKEHAIKIINYEKKEMTPLTKKEKTDIICKKFAIYAKTYLKLVTTKSEIIVIIVENTEVLLIIYAI